LFHGMQKKLGLSLGCCLLLVFSHAESREVQSVFGRPLKILSGDRLLLTGEDNTLYRIRLSGIEAPSPDSRWGAAAKRHLGTLVLGRVVRVEFVRWQEGVGSLPAKVLLGGADVNLRLIQAGLARHTPSGQPATERTGYAEAERRARHKRQGIWSQDRTTHRPRARQIPGGPIPRLGK